MQSVIIGEQKNKSMNNNFKHKLDIYYISVIAYGTISLVYVIISGGVIGEKFEVVWRDPIVYLLAICWLVSIVALVAMAVVKRQISVSQDEIIFHSRLRKLVVKPEDVKWIVITRERRTRLREAALPALRLKLKSRKRALWLRPAGFEKSGELVAAIKEWSKNNGVTIRARLKNQ